MITFEEFLERIYRPIPVVDNEQTRAAVQNARKQLMEPCNNMFIHNDIFEFEIRYTLLSKIKIAFYAWLRKIKQFRCRLFHDSSYIIKEFKKPEFAFEGYFRWYCCQNCKDTWLVPIKNNDKQ
jgi:hypothetical protein